MNPQNKTLIKTLLEAHLGRPATPAELVNMQNDALILARFLLAYAESLEARIAVLEGQAKVIPPVLTPTNIIISQ